MLTLTVSEIKYCACAAKTGLAVAGLRPSAFSYSAFQASIFTPDEEVATNKLNRELIPSWLDRFDGQITVLPQDLPLPRDVPKIILQDHAGTLRCEISSERINIHRRRTTGSQLDIDAHSFFGEASHLFADYKNYAGCRIGRLAAVVRRFAQHDSPGKYLAAHFAQERWLNAPLNRPENFELHAHKTYAFQEFHINSWMRCKTGFVRRTPEEQEPAILVEQDINTLKEETGTADFSLDESTRFFGNVLTEFGEILILYFPEEGSP